MAVTPRPAEPAAVPWPPLEGPNVEPPRANLTFIAAAPDLFAAYLSHLRDDGYAVSLAASVREASTQSEALCPDVVFLDLGESSREGLTMLRELKADDCLGAIPVVMLASFDSLDDINAGLELGACDYIIKTETTAASLARGVPAWAQIDRQLQAGLQESQPGRVAPIVPTPANSGPLTSSKVMARVRELMTAESVAGHRQFELSDHDSWALRVDQLARRRRNFDVSTPRHPLQVAATAAAIPLGEAPKR